MQHEQDGVIYRLVQKNNACVAYRIKEAAREGHYSWSRVPNTPQAILKQVPSFMLSTAGSPVLLSMERVWSDYSHTMSPSILLMKGPKYDAPIMYTIHTPDYDTTFYVSGVTEARDVIQLSPISHCEGVATEQDCASYFGRVALAAALLSVMIEVGLATNVVYRFTSEPALFNVALVHVNRPTIRIVEEDGPFDGDGQRTRHPVCVRRLGKHVGEVAIERGVPYFARLAKLLHRQIILFRRGLEFFSQIGIGVFVMKNMVASKLIDTLVVRQRFDSDAGNYV